MGLARVEGTEICLPLDKTYLPVSNLPDVRVDPANGGEFRLPYTPEHVRMVNRTCGSTLPGPVFAHWHYGGRNKPYLHQRFTTDFMTQNRRCFVLNGMGSGKTSSAIWAAEFLLEKGVVRRVLIQSPLSTLRSVWEREIFLLRPMAKVAVAHGSKEKRQKAIASGATYVITNHDSMRLKDMDPAMLAAEFDLVIVDEATVYKTWSSGGMPERYKAMQKLAWAVDRLWLLTGTPTPNSPLEAWSLIRLVDPTFRMSKTAFQNLTMRQVNEYKWIPKPDATDTVARMMQPAIRFSKEQVLAHLPPKVYTAREVPLSKEQTTALTEMKRKAVLELKGQKVTAANAAVLLGKLLQIAGGAVFDETGKSLPIDMGPRLAEIEALISQAAGKVLIFASFTETVKAINLHLKKKGYRTGMIYGGTSLTARTQIFRGFQEDDTIDVITAHPGTMAHGVTLTEADLVIWATPVMSNELFEQANERPHRPGQKRSVTIAQIYSTPQESQIYSRLRKRGDMQSELLGLVEDWMK